MRSLSLLLLASSLAIATTAHAAAAPGGSDIRYSVLIMGNPAGAQTTTREPDGSRTFTFEFNDRGRGPKLTSSMRLAADGTPLSVTTSGNDYLKAQVEETFTVAGGVARWKNNAEQGERKLTGPAFYVSQQSMPEELGLLTNALLATADGRLPLLPEGEATVRRTGETTLGDGSHTRRVIAYEISGLGFTPQGVWLEEDGTFFASVSSWVSFIREGWESSAPRLLELQDEIDARRTTQLARALTRKPTTPLAIINANLFDPVSRQSLVGSTVVIEGNRIKSVGKDGAVDIPSNAERLDARGRALLPGLWDMHVHIGPGDGILHLAAGVTSVRDLANNNDALQALRTNIDAGEEIGPRITMVGIMDGPGPFAGPTKVLVDTPEQVRGAIDDYRRWGYEGVKVYSSIKPELVPDIMTMARAEGLRVSGHVPAHMTARQFVTAGADELQHINFVFLNFFDDVKDTRTPARFTTVADRAATLDLQSEPVNSFVQLLKDKGTVVDPTVTIFTGMFTDRPGQVSSGYAAIAERLPPQVRRSLLAGGLPVPEGKDQRYRDSAQALLRMIKRLHDAGVPLVAGTDAMPGFTLHRELELYVEAGISAPEVLAIATIGAARVMKREQLNGSIAPGKLADLILVDGDPARRIGDIRRISTVLKDGQVYDPAALYRAVGVQPLTAH